MEPTPERAAIPAATDHSAYDPDERIVHRDGHLHCPWLAGPVPDGDVEELGAMLTTLMQSRGY